MQKIYIYTHCVRPVSQTTKAWFIYLFSEAIKYHGCCKGLWRSDDTSESTRVTGPLHTALPEWRFSVRESLTSLGGGEHEAGFGLEYLQVPEWNWKREKVSFIFPQHFVGSHVETPAEKNIMGLMWEKWADGAFLERQFENSLTSDGNWAARM